MTSSRHSIASSARTAASSQSTSREARCADTAPTSSRASGNPSAAEFVNRDPAELLNIQHEYGLFGGERGEWLVDLLRSLRKPAVLTLHTVLPEPDETMLRVTERLCRYSTRIISLSETGRELLERVYGIDPTKLRVIHHGVPDVPFSGTEATAPL